MKLSVSSTNEHYYYPDIENNLKLEEKDRFAIVVKRVNPTLSGSEWVVINDKGEVAGIDNRKRIKSQIKKLVNAPVLDIEGKEREMTIDDLLSDSYPIFYDVVTDLNIFMGKLDEKGGEVETKKS
ncbi:MAG: hypothetical protein GY782_03350 [Gammaproteobacteria bacterium]|nr:hypothetical protein [Gammaproteobacteria bacterium]